MVYHTSLVITYITYTTFVYKCMAFQFSQGCTQYYPVALLLRWESVCRASQSDFENRVSYDSRQAETFGTSRQTVHSECNPAHYTCLMPTSSPFSGCGDENTAIFKRARTSFSITHLQQPSLWLLAYIIVTGTPLVEARIPPFFLAVEGLNPLEMRCMLKSEALSRPSYRKVTIKKTQILLL